MKCILPYYGHSCKLATVISHIRFSRHTQIYKILQNRQTLHSNILPHGIQDDNNRCRTLVKLSEFTIGTTIHGSIMEYVFWIFWEKNDQIESVLYMYISYSHRQTPHVEFLLHFHRAKSPSFCRRQFQFNIYTLIRMSSQFAPRDSINNKPALFQIIASCWTGDKPLSEGMMCLFTEAYMHPPAC